MLNRVQNYKEIPKSQNLLCQNIPKSQNLLCQNIPESQNLLYLGLRINTFRKGWWKLRNRWKLTRKGLLLLGIDLIQLQQVIALYLGDDKM